MSAWTRLWAGPARRWRVEGGTPGMPAAPMARAISGRLKRSWSRRGGMPRVLFINQYGWPDHASTAQHLTDLAESLVRKGHEVHVLCSRGGYKPGQPMRPRREVHNGVTIHRVGATAMGRRSTITRMADYLSFYLLAAVRSLMLPRPDVVVTLTTPPLIALLGMMLKALRGSRHVSWSMDLHPDASLALGRMKKTNPIVRLLAHLADSTYRAADRVVVLGDYMGDLVAAKKVRPSRIVTIPVWSRRDEITPCPREGHPLRERFGLSDRFVAMYSGNHGLAHSFDEFLEAARRLRDRDDIAFLFLGDGPRRDEVVRAKEEDGLANVVLMDYVPRSDLHLSLTIADVHLISMRSEMTGIVVPSKVYGAMASGRPCLFVGPDHCEVADAIREASCGLTVRLGEPGNLVSALELLASDPDLRARYGERGREAFLARYERAVCCDAWASLVEDLVGVPAVEAPLAIATNGR